MLTSSVNVAQPAFPEADQGDISGLSRSVSNLRWSLGVALAGSILAAVSARSGKTYALSVVMLVVISLLGLAAAALIPRGDATRGR
jgi:hypothetical protein